jgi:tRNA-2-methylthio-N6-dimethylallyladenosine synthase
MKYLISIETFGCQMNILDSQSIIENLKKKYIFTQNKNLANIILYNTCSVRSLSEHKIISRVGFFRKTKQKKHIILGIIGCMAERVGINILKQNNHINFIIGPNQIYKIPSILKNIEYKSNNNAYIAISNYKNRHKYKNIYYNKNLNKIENFDFSSKKKHKTKNKSFIKINTGCDKFCSFCVVPKTRGILHNKNSIYLIRESKNLSKNNICKITLIGQTINKYNFFVKNKKILFHNILEKVYIKIPKLKRIKFLTNHPKYFNQKIINIIKFQKRICKYFHLPAQSGSNKILKLMNRGYKIEEYLEIISKIKNKIPYISIFGDMIVGFPDETKEDFEMSMQLLDMIKYKNIFVFKYSERSNTLAIQKYKNNISIKKKQKRHKLMLDFQKSINIQNALLLIKKTMSIFIKEVSKFNKNSNLLHLNELYGKSKYDNLIYFYGSKKLIKKTVNLKIISTNSSYLYGKLI